MQQKLNDKLNSIIDTYRNGNLADAREAVRKLNKKELAQLLINDHQLPNGFIGNPEGRYGFQEFVISALDW